MTRLTYFITGCALLVGCALACSGVAPEDPATEADASVSPPSAPPGEPAALPTTLAEDLDAGLRRPPQPGSGGQDLRGSRALDTNETLALGTHPQRRLEAPSRGCSDASFLQYQIGGPMPGPVVKLIPVFVGSNVAPYVTSNIGPFLTDLQNSRYMGWLRDEYGAPWVHFDGTAYTIPALTTDAGNVTDSQIQTALQSAIPNPLPSGPNYLYILHLPPGVVVSKPGLGTQCQAWSGYHSSIPNTSIAYAVMADFSVATDAGNCGALATCGLTPSPNGWYDALTQTESHEIAEALTDPFWHRTHRPVRTTGRRVRWK